uniref:Uncharacterized protein n=1 Tax=Panstrongylus lignarius TaxID=156445 RepID=A0A224Y3G6_9HEMI
MFFIIDILIIFTFHTETFSDTQCIYIIFFLVFNIRNFCSVTSFLILFVFIFMFFFSIWFFISTCLHFNKMFRFTTFIFKLIFFFLSATSWRDS